MNDSWGNRLKITLFGESHGEAIGIVIDGLPSGFSIDMDKINREMKRRAPGQNKTSTSRKESDIPRIVSGYFDGKTTGTALCAIIENTDTKSRDYSDMTKYIRPGHADFTGMKRYGGFNDYRGGGHFSGRLTAPIVFAGALVKQILEEKGIRIFGRVKNIAGIEDDKISYTDLPSDDRYAEAHSREIPALNEAVGELMREAVLTAKNDGDSVGGVVEVVVKGVHSGVGDPFFDSVESMIAHLAFSIPAVKGIEFGAGFGMTNMRGSETNDSYVLTEDKSVVTSTNNNGGILGGITNGMPIVFRTAIKPTPSISRPQMTVDVENMEETKLVVKGRHDPCIVGRVVPVMEAIAAIAIGELLL